MVRAQVVARGEGGLETVSATLDSVEGDGSPLFTTLGSGDHACAAAPPRPLPLLPPPSRLLDLESMLQLLEMRVAPQGG